MHSFTLCTTNYNYSQAAEYSTTLQSFTPTSFHPTFTHSHTHSIHHAITSAISTMLRCIFFSEFHHTTGPMLSFCVPQNLQLLEAYEYLNEYIITKPQLCHSLITVTVKDLQVMGFPVVLEHKKYERNKLLFNLGFAFDVGTDTAPYEPVCRKLAKYLRELELECEFVYRGETKALLPGIMQQLLGDLLAHRESAIRINEWCLIYVKLAPRFPDPPIAWDHQVPIFVADTSNFDPAAWDLAMQQIFPHIDGINHIAAIAAKTNMDSPMVRKCIQHLLYYQVATLVGIFQYSNVYVVTPRIRELYRDTDLQKACLKYVACSERQLPSLQTVFSLYCRLTPDTPLEAFCSENQTSLLTIDERRLVQFGLVTGLLRQLSKWPIRLKPFHPSDQDPIPKNMSRMLTGKRCYDEICCTFGLSHTELDGVLEKDPSILFVWK